MKYRLIIFECILLVAFFVAGCRDTQTPPENNTDPDSQVQCDDSGPQIIESEAETLIREYVSQNKPSHSSDYILEIVELQVSDLWNNLNIQLFDVIFLSDDGTQFNQSAFLYYDMKIVPFACSFGGRGIMSGYVDDDVFYFTYSWGSGIHRSHLGVIRIVDCEIQSIDSGGFEGVDFFVTKTDDGTILETGQFNGFNNWSTSAYFGDVVITNDRIIVRNDTADSIDPEFPSTGSVESCF